MNPTLESLLQGAVLAAAAWQASRIAMKPVMWRAAREAPGWAAGLGLLALVSLAACAWASAESDAFRRAAALGIAATLAAAAWRARPHYGAKRGLPPGTLGLGSSLSALSDYGFYDRQALRHGPVFKTSQFGRPVACILGLDRGRDLLLNYQDALEGASLPYTRLIPKGALRYMKNSDHRPTSRLIRSALAGTDLASSESVARQAFRSELEQVAFASASHREEDANGGVSLREAIDRAIFQGLVRIHYGMEPGCPEISEIREWNALLTFSEPGGRAWRRRIETGLNEVSQILRRKVERDATSGAGLPASASSLGMLLSEIPAALEDRTIAGNLIVIFRMAYRDVGDLLIWVFKMLSDNPQWIDRMREEPEAASTSAHQPTDRLATRIVMETLRLEQSEYLYRAAAKDFEFGGYRIPRGWLIRICIQESHRNPEIFENPTRFDPDRFARRSFGRNEYSPLGADAHGCMGTSIIHFLGRIFVEELTRGFEWEIVRDGPLQRGGTRHWHHWQPSSSLRATLTRRASRDGVR